MHKESTLKQELSGHRLYKKSRNSCNTMADNTGQGHLLLWNRKAHPWYDKHLKHGGDYI